jgi:hypothetical protein
MGGLSTVDTKGGRGWSTDETLFGVLDEALKDVRVRFVRPDGSYDVGGGTGDPTFVVRVTDPASAK